MLFKNLYKTVIALSIALITLNSCSKNEDNSIIDNRSIVTNTDVDFFINIDGTVNLVVSGTFNNTTDDLITFGNIQSRGFVFGTSSKQIANSTNTLVLIGPNPLIGYITNLPRGENYFIRGFFKMDDGTYFYGNEIQVSTDLDASTSRTISLEIEATPFFLSRTEVTPTINISNLTKEVPTEIGYEYSVKNDFSDSIIKNINSYDGATFWDLQQTVLLTQSYTTEVITGLTPSTTYYFRAYAKYADGDITHGGSTTVIFTTNN